MLSANRTGTLGDVRYIRTIRYGNNNTTSNNCGLKLTACRCIHLLNGTVFNQVCAVNFNMFFHFSKTVFKRTETLCNQ